MCKITHFWATCCLLCIGNPCFAQGKGERLLWKAFEPKSPPFFQEITTRVTSTVKVLDQQIKQTEVLTVVLRWLPEERDRQGNWRVRCEVARVKLKIDGVLRDIDADPKLLARVAADAGILFCPPALVLSGFTDLATLKVDFVISPKMTVKEIKGLDEFFDKAPELKWMRPHFSREAFARFVELCLAPLPRDAVAAGDSWRRTSDAPFVPDLARVRQVHRLTYQGREKDLDKISLRSQLELAAEQRPGGGSRIVKRDVRAADGKGVVLFDRKLGRLSRMEMTQRLEADLILAVGLDTPLSMQWVQEVQSVIHDDRPK